MKEFTVHLFHLPLRWLCLVVVLLVHVQVALCNTSTFYYSATANHSPRGAGKVYINTQATNNPAYATSSSVSGSRFTVNYGTATLYMYAQANDGFLFSHWAKGSATGETLSTSWSYNTQIQYDSESSRNPTSFSYYAVFTAQNGLIKVRTEDATKGSVSISDPNNQDGDVVTLTAIPDVSNGVLFEGWTRDVKSPYVSTDVVSMDNPLVLTASSETMGTYTAHFSDAANRVYVRLQNKATGRFLCFYGNNDGGGAANHIVTYSGRERKDGFKFDNCWKLISETEAQGNPETVFLRAGHAGGSGVTYGADLSAHGIAYSTLVHEENMSTNNHMLIFEKSASGDTYHIYSEFTINIPFSGDAHVNSYFCDEGRDWLVMKTTQSQEIVEGSDEWYVYTLDANTTEGAFGANTKSKYIKGEKYYTTMYADFPYQCLDGVKAYYLKHDESTYNEDLNMVFFTEVPGGKVPANMAVVLECDAVQNDFSSTKTVVNRLLPLLPGESGTPAEGSIANEFLHGYVSVNGDTRANNKETMYVLSFDKSLGFYLYNKDNMTPNKAYLDTRVALDESQTQSAKFAFGRTEIVNPDDPVDPDDPTETDIKGDMNNDGKISVTDVMILIDKVKSGE